MNKLGYSINTEIDIYYLSTKAIGIGVLNLYNEIAIVHTEQVIRTINAMNKLRIIMHENYVVSNNINRVLNQDNF